MHVHKAVYSYKNRMVAMPTSRDLDINRLCVDAGAGSAALATGSGYDLALTVAAPTCGLHVEEPCVDHFLQRDGSRTV